MDLQDFLPMESCLQQYCPFQQRLQRLPCYPPDTQNCLSLWFWRQALLLADSWAITSESLGTNYSSSSKASQIGEMKIMVTAFWENMGGCHLWFLVDSNCRRSCSNHCWHKNYDLRAFAIALAAGKITRAIAVVYLSSFLATRLFGAN